MRVSSFRHALLVAATGLCFTASSTAWALPPLVPQVKVGEEPPPDPAATPPAAATPAGPAESSTQSCTDGVDNDNDGLVDCADPSCRYVFACSKAARRSREDAVRAQTPEQPLVPATTARDLPQTGRIELNLPPPQLGGDGDLPRVVSESELPVVDRSGGSGRTELILGTVAGVAGVTLFATGLAGVASFGAGSDSRIKPFPDGAMMLAIGTGTTVASIMLLRNGVKKRAAYRQTEKLLKQISAVPVPSIDTRAGVYGVVSTVRF